VPHEADDYSGLLADIRRADTARGRAGLGCFAVEGTRLHERALRAGTPPVAALVSESFQADRTPRVRRLLRDLDGGGCRIRVAPDPIVAELTAGRSIGAIVGLVPLPASRSLDEILDAVAAEAPVLLVGLDVDDPGNIGALVRTALASGAAAFVTVGPGDPFHPRAVRTSMGSLLKLPLARYDAIDPLLADLARRGVTTLAAVSSGGRPLPEQPLGEGGVAVVVGSEAFGLPAETLARMDARVTIPMPEGVDSFTVNAAAAIVLYEIGRRRMRADRVARDGSGA